MDNLYVPSVEITAMGSHIRSGGEGGSISVTRRFWSTRIKKFAVLLISWQPPPRAILREIPPDGPEYIHLGIKRSAPELFFKELHCLISNSILE
jgi:hypothetical protein